MDTFPLYTNMMIDLPTKALTASQKRSFLAKVDKMDSYGNELIFALICAYYEKHGSGDTQLPYNGTEIEGSIGFDLNDLPKELGQLLYRFINVHLKKIAEDAKLAARVNRKQ